MMSIIDVARKDIGKKEKPGNAGFQDVEHEKRLLDVGWQRGWAWCACQIEAWAWAAFPDKKEQLKGHFVASAVNTFRNLVQAGFKKQETPKAGCFVFWQKYEDGKAVWTGHCGVVSEVINETTFKSIEGNTSGSGSRNGDGVYELTRTIKKEVQNGLKVIGFIEI